MNGEPPNLGHGRQHMLIAFLIAVGVACGLTSLLAVLMVVADATIGNYGTCRIRINDSKDLTVRGGRPLLGTLKDEGIFIPSACGGRGSCGLCKLKILDGAGGLVPTELPWLSAEEKAAGVRLSCQVKVKRDLRIEIPEELFSVRPYRAVVEAMRDLTYDIKEVRLKLVEPAEIDFKAGQFVQLEVPPYALTDEPVYRAYSVASDPAARGRVELEIRYVPNGICTTYVHKHLKVGDAVSLNGPYGHFFLRESQRPLVFIAGGSGMAPIKSILHEMIRAKNPRRARYFFGARAVRDLFLVDEMRAIEKQLPDFKFVPALSDPKPDDNWTGERGLITEVVRRQVDSAADAEAYLCGSPMMIDACIAVLKEKGMPESQIFYDKFA